MSEMTTTDAAPLLVQKRKKSFYEEEEIVIKPSTELIPDEYKHGVEDNVSLHIFRTLDNEDTADGLLEAAQLINYKVDTKNNIHDLNTREELLADLKIIKTESVNKSGLFLIFIGYFDKQHPNGTVMMMNEKKMYVHIKDVWSTFSANNCPELKNKPKIFIFCISQHPYAIQSDSMRHRTMGFDKVYDFPSESDMLIVYKKVDDVSPHVQKFLNTLTTNIKTFSKKYDIIDLVSHINDENNKFVPLVISTLTRKFYLTPNVEREHFLSIAENTTDVQADLKKIKEDLEKLHDLQKKKKEKMFSFSFKKKSEEKPKITKKEEKVKSELRKTSKVQDAPVPRTSGARLSTSSAVPVHRSRNTSESDSATTRTTNKIKKPIWRF